MLDLKRETTGIDGLFPEGKKKNHTVRCGFFLVETTGLEPVTSCV